MEGGGGSDPRLAKHTLLAFLGGHSEYRILYSFYIFIYFIPNKSNQSLSHGEQDLKVKYFTHLIYVAMMYY